jgi:hypothetical protein
VIKQSIDALKGLQDFNWILTSGNSFAELDSLLNQANSAAQNFLLIPPVFLVQNTQYDFTLSFKNFILGSGSVSFSIRTQTSRTIQTFTKFPLPLFLRLDVDNRI